MYAVIKLNIMVITRHSATLSSRLRRGRCVGPSVGAAPRRGRRPGRAVGLKTVTANGRYPSRHSITIVWLTGQGSTITAPPYRYRPLLLTTTRVLEHKTGNDYHLCSRVRIWWAGRLSEGKENDRMLHGFWMRRWVKCRHLWEVQGVLLFCQHNQFFIIFQKCVDRLGVIVATSISFEAI